MSDKCENATTVVDSKMPEMKLTIRIGGQWITMTIEEARKLYHQLDSILGNHNVPFSTVYANGGIAKIPPEACSKYTVR